MPSSARAKSPQLCVPGTAPPAVVASRARIRFALPSPPEVPPRKRARVRFALPPPPEIPPPGPPPVIAHPYPYLVHNPADPTADYYAFAHQLQASPAAQQKRNTAIVAQPQAQQAVTTKRKQRDQDAQSVVAVRRSNRLPNIQVDLNLKHLPEFEIQLKVDRKTGTLIRASITAPRARVALPSAPRVLPPVPPPPAISHPYPYPVYNLADPAAQNYAFAHQQQAAASAQHAQNAAMMAVIIHPPTPLPAFSHAHPYLLMHYPVDPAAQHYAYTCALQHQATAQHQTQQAAAMAYHAQAAQYQAQQTAAMAQHAQAAQQQA